MSFLHLDLHQIRIGLLSTTVYISILAEKSLLLQECSDQGLPLDPTIMVFVPTSNV